VTGPVSSEIAAIALTPVSRFVAMTAAVATAAWLTSLVRASGLVVLPAIGAGRLFVYFDWRAALRSRLEPRAFCDCA
jgi:hypothetical protein